MRWAIDSGGSLPALAVVAALLGGCAAGPPPLRPRTEAEVEEERVDPEVRALLAGLDRPQVAQGPRVAAAESARRDRARWSSLQPFTAPAREVARVADLNAGGLRGLVPLRAFWPAEGGERLPLVVYVHGGEYTAGSLGLFDSTCRALALGARAVVVAVGYGLAPEVAFPAPSADVAAAVRWVFAHAAELGIDPTRVALAGDDAGATLAVGEAVALGRAGGAPLRALALSYPLADARLRSATWRELGALPYLLTPEDFGLALEVYLRGARADDPRVSPVLFDAADLARLPRTLLLTAELDPARDDADLLAAALRRAGVSVEVRRSAGMVHGFLLLAGAVEPAARALDGLAAWLGRELAPRDAP
ncbi:MAG: alpha/beta hydrolase [Myxococcales bacterium]